MTPSTKQKMLELAEAYGAGSRHLKTSQHFIDGFTAASELYEASQKAYNSANVSPLEFELDKAAHEYMRRLKEFPRATRHAIDEFCAGARWQFEQTKAREAVLVEALQEITQSKWLATRRKIKQLYDMQNIARAALECVGIKT